jgi:hypothetical protein
MPNQDSRDEPLRLHQILEEEYARLHEVLPHGYQEFKHRIIALYQDEEEPERTQRINGRLVPEIYKLIHALPQNQARSALCLSGGGVRSATFALGIIQGLARSGLLHRFDYLSTVSGGGYIGSWLTAWIYRHWKSQGETLEDRYTKLKEVEAELGKPTKDPIEPEPKEIAQLRAYSHFLNPRAGFVSADTWTLVGTYLRNLLINWTVLIPLLAGVLMIPRLCEAFLTISPDWLYWWKRVTLIFGLVLGALAICYMGVNRPTSLTPGEKSRGQGSFLGWCLVPLIFSGVCLTTFWAWFSQLKVEPDISLFEFITLPGWLVFMIFGLLFHFLGWLGYSWRLWKSNFKELGVVAASGLLGGWLAWLAVLSILPESIPGIYVCLALPLFLLAYLVAATLFVGLVSRFTDDEDREWWARAGSWMLIVIVFWSGISSLVIFGPLALLKTPRILASVGGISGLISTILGWSAKTQASKEKPQTSTWQTFLVNKGLGLTAFVFLLVLVAALSLGTSWLLKCLSDKGIPFAKTLPWSRCWYCLHLGIIASTPWWLALLIIVALWTIGPGISRAMNINKFSLHAMYRSRLIRAYLGASREKRNPNLFTGFDPKDNIEMGELLPENNSAAVTQENKLLHLVNITLNLVHDHELAWQQRKAESFTASPLHCGNYHLGYRYSRDYGKYTGKIRTAGSEKSTQNSDQNDKSITLGTAVTISGAAVSPNMGYHSSPVISFLLTLFNIRLGAWLGNPADNETYRFSQPKSGLRTMLAEAFGLTDDKSRYVYLSDGGHFENLGLYEMVLRRCRFIIVSDATCDPQYVFDDLGNAIHKIRVDLGIPIEFEDEIHIYPRSDKEHRDKRKNCAIGRIRYSTIDRTATPDKDGILIYLKPAICGDEPVDVLSYCKVNDKFPHESTGDQFFNETQFESYRMLGFHTIKGITNNEELTGFKAFEELVRDYLKKPGFLGVLRGAFAPK